MDTSSGLKRQEVHSQDPAPRIKKRRTSSPTSKCRNLSPAPNSPVATHRDPNRSPPRAPKPQREDDDLLHVQNNTFLPRILNFFGL